MGPHRWTDNRRRRDSQGDGLRYHGRITGSGGALYGANSDGAALQRAIELRPNAAETRLARGWHLETPFSCADLLLKDVCPIVKIYG